MSLQLNCLLAEHNFTKKEKDFIWSKVATNIFPKMKLTLR